MSREAVQNGPFELAFGVDHVTSAFVSIYHLGAGDEEEDHLVVSINNHGLLVDDPNHILPVRVTRLNETTQKRFEQSRRLGNRYPNLDADTACDYAQALGFGRDVERRIRELWD
jgi:hypothetical protein